MNIKDAKEEIRRTLRAYTAPEGYRIPRVRQRPILLIGPPGIGKTAIVEQVAEECQAGFVSYTMTHHTRQSAIGLPFLKEKDYEGKHFSITEYTMSEIIASIYQYMEDSGHKTGILFIDEINCVSETLTPVMLQFLQNKTFGNHPVPEGWLIVAAGNPPEYNQSVREFDIVTMDRVKYMEIEAELSVWQDYARRANIHPAVSSYLALHPEHFYCMESNADGKHFVTARGWEDLSCILYSYESLKEPVTELLFGEYLRKEAIARSFSLYYRWYEKEKKDPRLADFLTGKLTDPSLKESLSNAPLEERFAAASLIASFLKNRFESWSEKKEELLKYRELFSDWHRQESGLSDFLKKRLESLVIRRKNALISIPDALWEQKLLEGLEDFALSLPQETQEENVRSFYAEKRASGLLSSGTRQFCRSALPLSHHRAFQKPSLRFLPRLSSGGSLLKRFVRASGLRPRGGIKKGRPGTFPEQPLIFFYFWPVVLPKPPFRISTASSSTVMPYSTKIPCIKPVPFSMQTTFPSLESLVSFAKIWPSLSE